MVTRITPQCIVIDRSKNSNPKMEDNTMNNREFDIKQLNAVIRLDVTISEPDFISPWQNSEQLV